ncbi:TetR/AcrR family transcriptional regulator [Parvularcula sp. IMCC14364]|uniref:TetR/AcrR family transcriptional regulator n=1 Tax=Parvularcula sp. IMCC14364 TaxID=3067902 RepID=UPI002740ED22|nr:TetR/AcrR family transcriptional regulator [Parvularcula sp. IMCC14364]
MQATSYHHGNLREALIDRAAEVIGEKGVEGVSLRSLARDLGVSHAAPSRHFPTKADLLAAVVRKGYELMTQATMQAGAQAGDNPVLRLNLMVKCGIRWAVENRSYFMALMNPDVRHFADADLRAALSEYYAMLTEAAAGAQQAGLFDDMPTRAALLHGFAATTGAQMIFTDELIGETVGGVSDSLIDEIADMIVPLNG